MKCIQWRQLQRIYTFEMNDESKLGDRPGLDDSGVMPIWPRDVGQETRGENVKCACFYLEGIGTRCEGRRFTDTTRGCTRWGGERKTPRYRRNVAAVRVEAGGKTKTHVLSRFDFSVMHSPPPFALGV